MPPWTRASELHRAIACPASVVLPRGPDTTSDAAAFGRELHAWKAGEPPTPRVTRWLAHQDAKWTRDLLWPGPCHEVLLGAYGESGAYWHEGTKTENEARRAALDDTWVAGEADLVDPEAKWVDDLKTGWHPGPPRTLPQIRFYLLAAARWFGWKEWVLGSITHWPRYPLGTPPTRWTEVLDVAELEAWWAGVVEPARVRAQMGGAEKRPGSHCKFCRVATCEFKETT